MRNAACYDKKLVISERFGKSKVVHLWSPCRAIIAVASMLCVGGCQTGLQRAVPIQTEVLAPDLEVAPAANVEVPAPRQTAGPIVPQTSLKVLADESLARSAWPTNWVDTWISLESWRRF